MGMFDPLGGLPGAGDPYTKPIKGWESWQPQGPGPRLSGTGYGMPPQPDGAYWTNQYNYQAPKMYQPNAENHWTVYGRPDQYPWPGGGDANSLLGSISTEALNSDPRAALEALLTAYGLNTRQNALTTWTRQQSPWLEDQFTVKAAQAMAQNPNYSYLDFLQNDATNLLDAKWRASTAQQQGRNPSAYAGRVRSVGGGMTGF